MSISSSLNAGVMGLTANANRLSTISDNIANSSTYGYKRSVTEFSSLVVGGARDTFVAGGVRTSKLRLIDEQGALVGTSNATDIAIRGRGMIPVTTETAVNAGGDRPMLLQSTGSFRPDEEGYLKSASGHVLLGWPALPDGSIPAYPRDTDDALEPVQISMNAVTGSPTTEMSLAVNLPATATAPGSAGDPETLTVEYFDNLGRSETVGVSFSPTVPAVAPSSNEWTMTLTDSAQGGAVIGEYLVTFNDTRAAGGSLASVTTLSGGAYNPATGELAVTVASGPLSVQIGRPNTSEGLTQLADRFAPVSIVKDGSPVGNIVGVEIDEAGLVRALYDVGVTRVMYQVPLADVPNVNGLTALDSQTYQTSGESGGFFLWNAGEGPTGEIVNFARAQSTTDVAKELTDLIETQRAYSSNAKVIQTVDEMLQETTNIKR